MVAATGPHSAEQNLALAQRPTLRRAVEARSGTAASVDVAVVDDGSLEFRVRSRDRTEASEQANAYAQAYVELREKQLVEEPLPDRAGPLPTTAAAPRIVSRASPAGSPLPPWPSETWTLAGMVLIALAVAIPDRDTGD
jgi:hypothetical protein